MKKTILLVLVLALGLATMGLAAEHTWTRKADMPTARTGLSASVVDGKIYAIGGGTSTGVVISTVEQYDPATDIWTKKANMRTPRTFFAASMVNGKIYAIGGYGFGGAHLSIVEEYDPVADTWTTRARMPTVRDHLSTSVVDGKIYAIGGLSGVNCVGTVEEYDPATDIWTRKADMPTRRGQVSCSTADGIIYAIGGFTSVGGSPMSAVEAYDPATDTWTRKTDMPTARSFLTTSVVNGKIYAIGGCANPYNSSELSSVEAYDPATDTWSKMADMLTARKALASSAVNGKIYAIGGTSVAGWDTPLSSVEEYEIITPPPDFNGDGIVDIKDLLRLIQSWGQDDPMVDIAPPPFGDGIVDAMDLELLMSYWEQPIDDATLIAHWALDEAQGDIAYDNAGICDGTLLGAPVWQPIGGMVDGALLLDGVDDYVITNPILDPAKSPFSVLAWIKGGAPGQTVLSQMVGVRWLCADPSEGNLMTELKGTGRDATTELLSQTIITDGDWHRIGLVWDGSHRTLYVDDVLVAEDAQTNLLGSDNGLYIGSGTAMEPGSFWSGLIDDVRIYNRAVTP